MWGGRERGMAGAGQGRTRRGEGGTKRRQGEGLRRSGAERNGPAFLLVELVTHRLAQSLELSL